MAFVPVVLLWIKAELAAPNGELILGYPFPIENSAVGTGFTLLTYLDGDADEYEIRPTAGPAQGNVSTGLKWELCDGGDVPSSVTVESGLGRNKGSNECLFRREGAEEETSGLSPR